MGKKDVALAKYFEDERRYADLLNVFLFQGEQVIRSEDIKERDSAVHAVVKQQKRRTPVRKIRDMIRKVALGVQFVIAGIEHQDSIHYAMPVRVMLEDAVMYDKQMQKIRKLHKKKQDVSGAEFLGGYAKKDFLAPVFTLVLYYGDKPWDGAKELYELIDQSKFPIQIIEKLNNYKIHILEVRKFHQTDKFRTDLREVFRFIQCMDDKGKMKYFLEEMGDRLRYLEEDAYDVMVAMAEEQKLELQKEIYQDEKGRVNMCKGLRDWIMEERMEAAMEAENRGILEGRLEGKLEGKKEIAFLLYQRNSSVEDTAEICQLDLEQVQKLYSKWESQNIS